MTNTQILFDTSLLIEYVRKQKKEQTLFYRLSTEYTLYIAAITEYEFLLGRNPANAAFSDKLLQQVTVLPMDSRVARLSVEIYRSLKQKNALIGTNDIFIAATALQFEIPIATLNRKHFSRVETDFGVQLLSE